MRKLLLAFTITLVLSLALGGGLAFAANLAAPGEALNTVSHGFEALKASLAHSEPAVRQSQRQVSAESLTELQAQAVQEDNPLLEEPLVDPENEANDGAYCRGDKTIKHPVGEKLAGEFFGADDPAAFEAGYTEIMGWFCGSAEGSVRYGFGEIRLGYQIAAAAGLTPEEIFALRAEGKGWGNILKDLGLKMKDVKPSKPDKPPKPENGNNGQGNAYGQDKEKGNNGQGNAYGHDKDKGNKGKKP